MNRSEIKYHNTEVKMYSALFELLEIVFKVFVENLSTFNVDKYYNFLLENVFIPLLSKKGIEDQLAIKYISKYYLSGVTSVVLDWINKNCIDDIDYVSKTIIMCNKYTIL